MRRGILITLVLFILALVAARAVGLLTPNVGNGPSEQRSENIIVLEPESSSEVESPFTLSGEARVFENTVLYRLSQTDGRVLAEGVVTAQAKDIGQFGPFETEISFPLPTRNEGVLEVFQQSAKDGSEIDKVTVDLVFRQTAAELTTVDVRVYFGNAMLDPQNCEATFPLVRTVEATQAVGRAALLALLQGPTEEERQAGYFTGINEGVSINNLTVEDGIARVDFDGRLEESVAGSCRVAQVRAQITHTLLQFPTVREVVISVEGRTEDILQP